NSIESESVKEYSLSSLAASFKEKIKSKQNFIESGMNLLKTNSENCPFCEQNLEDSALHLIDHYTTYLTDVEAQTIKYFLAQIVELNTLIDSLKSIEDTNIKRINEFNTF